MSSLPTGKHHSLYVRFSRTNATVSKVHTLFNCCILRKAYFRQCSWHCLKTLRVCLAQTSPINCTFSCHYKSAAIRHSSPFDRGCGCQILRNVTQDSKTKSSGGSCFGQLCPSLLYFLFLNQKRKKYSQKCELLLDRFAAICFG